MKEDIENTSNSSVAESGRLSGRPRKIHLRPTRNVHKAAHGNVQSDSVHGQLAQGTWQCSRKCLPVPECCKREEQNSDQP